MPAPPLFELRSSSLGAWLLAALAVLCVVAIPTRSADAQCANVGTNRWECSGFDSDGLDLGTTDDQVVDVLKDAGVIADGDNLTAIRLGDDSTINIERGAAVVSDGSASRAIAGGHQIRLNNKGSLLATGSGSVALDLDSDGATSGISDIENDDVIGANGAGAVGVRIDGRVDLVNRGVIDAGGAGAVAVSIAGDGSEIINSSLIQSRAGAVAIRFQDGGSGNVLTNERSGAIIASDGIAIVGGDGDELVNNRGFISGDVLLGGGDDTLILHTSGPLVGAMDGGAGTDRLIARGGGIARLDLDSVTGFETFEFSGSGGLALSGSAAFPGGTTFSDGSIGIFDSVVLTGDVQQRRRNVLGFGLADGTLSVDGEMSIAGGLALIPQGITQPGQRTLIDTSAGLTGRFSELPNGTALLDFRFSRTPNSLRLDVTRNSYASQAEHEQQREVGRYLDDIAAAGPGRDLDELMGRLDVLDRDRLLDAYDSLDPQFYDAQTSASFDMGREFDAVLRRPPVVCEVGEGPGSEERAWRPCDSDGLTPWFLGWGSYRDRDSVGGDIGYEQAGGGLAIGAQQRLFPWLEVGAGVGAARRHIDVDDNGSGSITTLDLGVNAAGLLGPVALRGAVSFGYGWHDSNRDVDWPGYSRRASGDFDHRRVGVSFEGAPRLEFGRLRIEPFAGFDYTWLDEDDIDETGAGELNLDVDDRTNSLLAFDTGLRLRGYFYTDRPINEIYDFSNTAFVPELRLGYRRVLTGQDRDVDASLPSAPDGVGDFGVDAKDAEEELLAGIGLTIAPRRGATVSLVYDFGYGDRNVSHTGAIQVRIPLQFSSE